MFSTLSKILVIMKPMMLTRKINNVYWHSCENNKSLKKLWPFNMCKTAGKIRIRIWIGIKWVVNPDRHHSDADPQHRLQVELSFKWSVTCLSESDGLCSSSAMQPDDLKEYFECPVCFCIPRYRTYSRSLLIQAFSLKFGERHYRLRNLLP